MAASVDNSLPYLSTVWGWPEESDQPFEVQGLRIW